MFMRAQQCVCEHDLVSTCCALANEKSRDAKRPLPLLLGAGQTRIEKERVVDELRLSTAALNRIEAQQARDVFHRALSSGP